MTASALEAAYMDLRARVAAADEAGDWQERCVLAPLADVADQVKRVGDHPDSAPYRAGKVGELVDAALRVQRETMLAYAGWPDPDHEVTRAIEDATTALVSTVEALRRAMWAAATGAGSGSWHRSAPEALGLAAADLSRWAARLARQVATDQEQR